MDPIPPSDCITCPQMNISSQPVTKFSGAPFLFDRNRICWKVYISVAVYLRETHPRQTAVRFTINQWASCVVEEGAVLSSGGLARKGAAKGNFYFIPLKFGTSAIASRNCGALAASDPSSQYGQNGKSVAEATAL